jgi:hypothetical protein
MSDRAQIAALGAYLPADRLRRILRITNSILDRQAPRDGETTEQAEMRCAQDSAN